MGLFAIVMTIAIVLQTYGMRSWPMADDEVPSLVELGILHIGAEQFFSVPATQIGRLPRAVPVWYGFQRAAMRWMPQSEAGYRLPSVVCGLLTTLLLLTVAWRWRGPWFAAAAAIVLLGSQPFIYLQQVDRFYGLPLLLLLLTQVLIWWPGGRPGIVAAVVVLAGLTVLAHNITVPVFGLGFLAALPLFVLRRVPRTVVVRSAAAAVVAAGIYVAYVRPLMLGWHSTGNPTPVLVSFVAHAGTPALALGLLGAWLGLSRRDTPALIPWSAAVLAGSFCLFQLTAGSMSWNPRYFLFYLPALWMLAAYAMAVVAERLGGGATAAAWYAAVGLMLAPSILSHLADGSRHDYRRAAEVIRAQHVEAPILSDDAETISYYLPAELRQRLAVRTKVTTPPVESFFLVARSNAWMPQPSVPGRRIDLLAEISRRRFDQFSHVLRVYRVGPAEAP